MFNCGFTKENNWFRYRAEEILESRNREWFILALSRLALLSGENKVVNIEYFSEENVPLPLEKTKRIIRKCKDEEL